MRFNRSLVAPSPTPSRSSAGVGDRQAGTVITDGQNNVVAVMICFERSPHPDHSCPIAAPDAMLDRVLYKWLQKQVWHQRPHCLRRDIEEYGEPIAIANLLDSDVTPGERHLFTEGYFVLVVAAQCYPQQISEPGEHLARGFRILSGQRRNVLQAIEQEMRVQTHAQRLQLCQAKRRFQIRFLQRQPRFLLALSVVRR